MKIRTRDSGVTTSAEAAKSLDDAGNTPLTLRDETGTHHGRSNTGIVDSAVVEMITSHKAAIKRNQDAWHAIHEREAARGWVGRLFPHRVTPAEILPPIPPPLPTYIVARARELGLL